MYGLFPIAYPIAKLLDRLLGASHGLVFNRAGLKELIMLHGHLNTSNTERLSREETIIFSSVLGLKDVPISLIMTPLPRVFTLSFDTYLDDMTRYKILKSGYTAVPIHTRDQPTKCMVVLQIKPLVALNNEEEIAIGQLALESLLVVKRDASCQ
jgi:metal transporter CNNM